MKTSIMLGAAVLIGAILGVVALTAPETDTETHVVHANFGGAVDQFIKNYNEWEMLGDKLIINGPCASACTYFLGLMPREDVCATDKAIFGFHGVYLGSRYQAAHTSFFADYVYPDYVQEAVKTVGYDFHSGEDIDKVGFPTGMAWLSAAQLQINNCDTGVPDVYIWPGIVDDLNEHLEETVYAD